MKRLIAVLFFLFVITTSFGQNTDIKSMVDSLQHIKADTLDCKADLYWKIISKGKQAIPFLIDKLTDSTPTNIRFHCKKTRLNVGEVAYFALTQIADFPTFVVTKMQFHSFTLDETGQLCWNFFDFFFINSNKPRYQKDIKNWYASERLHYIKEKILKKKQSDCQKKYGINKFYRWIE